MIEYNDPIRFGVSISLPESGRFLFEEQYQSNPERFLKEWIGGAVSNIYTGPIHNETGHAGELLLVPIIRVRHSPLIVETIKHMFGRR